MVGGVGGGGGGGSGMEQNVFIRGVRHHCNLVHSSEKSNRNLEINRNPGEITKSY